MAAFTKRAQCGHLQMVVADNATEATMIVVVSCARCNDEYSTEDKGHFARPKLAQGVLFGDESMEIENEFKPGPDSTVDLAAAEEITIVISDQLVTFKKWSMTRLHLVLLWLNASKISTLSVENEGTEKRVRVNAPRAVVLSALYGIDGIRFLKYAAAAD